VSSQDKVLLAIEDITEDKRKELNLKESRDFYLSLFDNLPALIMTLDINMQGDYFNKKYLEFTGFSSKNIEKIDWAKAIHPSDYKRYNDLFIERFKKHKVLYLEHRMKRYDGEYRWMSSRANPYYDIDGVFGGYIVSAYDITDEKEAVQKLEESEKKYKKLFMNMLNGFCYHKVVFDEMGKIVDFILLECNDAYLELTGLCEHEIVGRRFTEVFDELYNSSFDWINTLGSVELTGEIVNFEVNVFNEDSLWINVLAYSTEKGYIAVLVSDITMKKRTEIEKQKTMKIVKEAYRTKSEFLANMSHEIRTPLNGIIGMIDLTMLTNLDEEQEDNLNTAKNCADSLLHIINDILDFSKLEAGKMKLANKEFNINELINKISRIHSYKAKEKYLNFSSKIQEDMPNIVIGDANRLQQVLNNLISNAIKFTDKGSVNIFLSVVDKTNKNIKVRFEVIDTGIGISKEEMNKLFVSFSQVDGSRTRTYGGTGLGLVISKQIIEMAGGSIDVISEKGRGSTFFFDFQFDLPVNENKQDNIINEENLLSNYSANILVVEDDRINQFVISKQLKKLGHTCTIVNNGIEAIEMLKKRYYDLCLMDIQMPVLDGIDTTTIIRKNEEKTDRYLPIIALTAHALAGDREKFLNIGMDEYLSKPCQIKNLFNVTEKILNKFKKSSITQEILNANKNKEIESYNILIKNIKKNIAFLEENILNEDISEIESTSHNLKDIAEKLNLNDIKVLSFRIELAARKKDMIEVLELKNELTLKTKVYIENI
jgi:PAS domain S-box-containing protein